MKRKLIALTFMLSVCSVMAVGQDTQTDAYFLDEKELRYPDAGVGFVFGDFKGLFGQGFNFEILDNQQGGFGFEELTGGSVPAGNGLLLMTATGLIYFINKRRKENEK